MLCVYGRLFRFTACLPTSNIIIVCSLELFYCELNFGIDFICVNSKRIYFDIYSLANPKLMIFCKNGKNINDDVTELAYMICLNNPKHTSYGKTGS